MRDRAKLYMSTAGALTAAEASSWGGSVFGGALHVCSSGCIYFAGSPQTDVGLQGDGRVMMATREYMLGEHLPDLHITFWVGCSTIIEYLSDSIYSYLTMPVTCPVTP